MLSAVEHDTAHQARGVGDVNRIYSWAIRRSRESPSNRKGVTHMNDRLLVGPDEDEYDEDDE